MEIVWKQYKLQYAFDLSCVLLQCLHQMAAFVYTVVTGKSGTLEHTDGRWDPR